MTVDTVTDPFGQRTDETDADLGQLAAQGLDDEGPAQGALVEGPEPGKKIKFLGMSFEDTPDAGYALGTNVTFVVKGTVIGEEVELMADGHKRLSVKVRVSKVTAPGDEE